MALMLKNGAVFLHIPKTGGNWVTAVLKELDLVEKAIPPKHADIDYYYACPFKTRKYFLKHTIKECFFSSEKPFMFCFVRDPLTWYESWFKYQTHKKWVNFGDENSFYKWHPNAMLNQLGSTDFNQFVQNVIKKRPGYVTELYGWYTKPMVNFIGKHENLVDDLIRVLGMMNINFDESFIREYKKVGVSPKPQKPIVWDDALKKKVVMLEYSGIIRYGYLKRYENVIH